MQQSPASFLDWTSQFATEDACLFKRFLLGTFHGVSGKYLQEYLDEFVFRFNRRYWEFHYTEEENK